MEIALFGSQVNFQARGGDIDLLVIAATEVLRSSHDRIAELLTKAGELSVEEEERVEAFTARFSRLSDLLVQRIFRTLDQIELVDEGSLLDRLLRMEKRSLIHSADLWKRIRLLGNAVAHEYLVSATDEVVQETAKVCPELFSAVQRIQTYVEQKKLLG